MAGKMPMEMDKHPSTKTDRSSADMPQKCLFMFSFLDLLVKLPVKMELIFDSLV